MMLAQTLMVTAILLTLQTEDKPEKQAEQPPKKAESKVDASDLIQQLLGSGDGSDTNAGFLDGGGDPAGEDVGGTPLANVGKQMLESKQLLLQGDT